MKKMAVIALLMSLTGCTYSISMFHSDRSNGSTDTQEEQQTAQPNISPNINPMR